MSALACVVLWLSLTAGNVIYAYFTDTPNSVLFERAYFQGAAFFTAYIYLRLTK